jgi:UDP-N-acetylglucosamine acyltransferase
MTDVHPTAVIAPGAVIGEGSSIGAYSVIGPDVRLGRNCRVGPHVVIEGHTELGDENIVYQFASVGSAPQDLKFKGEPSRLVIGSRNQIREYVTLQPGTSGGGMLTSIGSQNLFMACSHVGHDAHIGEQNIFANSSSLAGHVTVGSFVTIGGLCGIHQFVRLGDHCLLGAGSMVNKDVPPYCIAQGDRAGLAGINRIGLERRGFAHEEVTQLRVLYRHLFMGEGKFAERLEEARRRFSGMPHAAKLLQFVSESARGVTLPRRHREAAADEGAH